MYASAVCLVLGFLNEHKQKAHKQKYKSASVF